VVNKRIYYAHAAPAAKVHIVMYNHSPDGGIWCLRYGRKTSVYMVAHTCQPSSKAAHTTPV